MEDKNVLKFKKQLSVPVLYFSVFYIIYIGIQIFNHEYQNALVIFAVGVLIYAYLYGIRPYGYEIQKRTLILKRFIGKSREINLMDAETISNPKPKMTKIITNAHSYEIYLVGGKRVVVSPSLTQQMDFIEAVIHANKRIDCQVKEYNETHRKVEKRRKRDNKKENQETVA